MASKKVEGETAFKSRIPEEARQRFRKAREEMREAVKVLFPEGFLEHRRAARREMLLAVRSLLDTALQRMEEEEM